MANEQDFAVDKLSTYTNEEIAGYKQRFDARATRLQSLAVAYNDKVSEAQNLRASTAERLAAMTHWGSLRDVADDLAAEVSRKSLACQVEIDFRA